LTGNRSGSRKDAVAAKQLRKIKRWLDESDVKYENKSSGRRSLGISISGIHVILHLATDYLLAELKVELPEEQVRIIRKMKGHERLALEFHIRKEIVRDPFLFYGYPSGFDMVKGGTATIALVVHNIYYDLLTKERLMYTLAMLWKNYNKYLMIVQEHTHYPY
jgi:hypothetical protein